VPTAPHGGGRRRLASSEVSIDLRQEHALADLDAVRLLMREYEQSLGISLCFQGFEEELAALPGDYAPPLGALVSAWVGDQLAGCCALRPLANVDYTLASEMKRLYVRPAFRGMGLGRLLAQRTLDLAAAAGHQHVLLDTLSDMETARALYQDLGFAEIPAYYHNPITGAHYLMVRLD
jgi:putative acetyltransferase